MAADRPDPAQQLKLLQQTFHSQLPERLRSIREAWQQCSDSFEEGGLELMYRLVHSLSGAGGTFGALEVSQAARNLESHIKAVIEQPNKFAASTASINESLSMLAESISRWQPNQFYQSLLTGDDALNNGVQTEKTVYLVEDDALIAQEIIHRLEESGFVIQHFLSLNEFEQACKESLPHAVLMDMMFHEGGIAGAETIIRTRKELQVPVIFISVRGDIEARLAAVRAGASRYFTKPLDYKELVDALNGLTQNRPTVPYRVLIIDDEPLLAQHHAEILKSQGIRVQTLSDPLESLQALESFDPELIVLDLYMPDCTGYEVAAVVRQDKRYAQLPIVFLSAETDPKRQYFAMDLGGDDFLTKPVIAEHLLNTVTVRLKRYRWLNRLNRQLESALREAHYQQLAMDQHAIVSIADPDGRITYANDRFSEISGYSRAELIGKTHNIVNSGIHPVEFFEAMWQTITQGGVWQGDVCNRRKDGSLYWVSSTIVPFLGLDGQPYQYVSVRTDITAIKNAEEQLRSARDQLNHLLESSPVVLYSLMPKHGQLVPQWVSGNVEKLVGYCSDEVLSPEWWPEHLHPADKEETFARIAELSHSKGLVHEYRFRHRDGHYRWIHDQLTIHRDEQGEAKEIIGAWTDITELREIQQRLMHNEERLRRSQVYANIGTWDWNIQSGDLYWSERIAPLFGYEQGELETTYENFLNAVHPDDRQSVIDAVNACVEHGEEYNIEHRVVWPTGDIRWVLEKGDVVRDSQGTPQHMLGVVQDITDRKLAEEALKHSEQHLKQAQRMGSIGHWSWNAENGELLWSDETYRIFGVKPESFELSRAYFSKVCHPDDLSRVLMTERDAFSEGRGNSVDYRILRPDGEIRWVHEQAMPSFASDGRLLTIAGITQDITDRKRSEADLVQAKESAEQANKAKSQFLSAMSHELRTPMNAILGFAQLMEMDPEEPLGESQKENVDEILKAGRHLLELINEVLDLAKIESGNIDMDIKAVSVNSLVNECVSLLRPLAAKQGITIENRFESSNQQFVVNADQTRLKQVLLNLMSNAVKYNRASGSVALDCEIYANQCCIKISDTGMGIAAEDMDELFKPFSRLVDATSGIEGTGIGLVVTKELVELMGGSIGVESEVGVGSTFWLQLRMAGQQSDGGESDNTSGDDFAVTEIPAAHTILYIEDNPANLRLVSRLLGYRDGIELLTAHEPGLGLGLAIEHQPDLILLDINLPGTNGFDVLAKLKSMDETSAIPVVAVSANAMPEDISRGLEAGFADYIVKPIDTEIFLHAIDRGLALP